MTRQQYMNWKTSSPINILYHYYTTHEKLNHKPLDPQNLIMQLQLKGCNVNKILQDLIEEYDRKYDLVALLDQHGQFIKYL
jgi:hypothetical protein